MWFSTFLLKAFVSRVNVAQSYVGPLLLATLLTSGTGLTLALVWGAHFGFDRALVTG